MSQKFITYNASGAITGFYDAANFSVPSGASSLNVTDEDWVTALATPGYTVSNGALTAPTTPTAEQIAAQQAAQGIASNVSSALAAGLAIVSTSTPAIDGTYPLDSVTQFEINSVMLFIQANGDFPGGASSYPWYDVAGAAHIFPSIAVFKEWATAIANYVAALKLYGAGATNATLPASSVTIS